MKSKTHHMAEAITEALGPIFRANPDYTTICQAMALTLARVAQATPKPGNEYHELDAVMCLASEAVTQFLDAEQAIQEQEAKLMDKGISAFAEMARGVVPVEPGSSADYPDNCDQPVAKSQQPWPPKADLEEACEAFVEQIAEGGNPGEFGYKIVDGEESPAGRTYEEINQVIRAAGGTPEAYDQAKANNA